MANVQITLTNAQAVAVRKLQMTSKRSANKEISAEQFAAKLLNSVLTSRYEPLHKALKQFEAARYDAAIQMGATPKIVEVKNDKGEVTKRPETKQEYVSRIIIESDDILEALKNGGDVE